MCDSNNFILSSMFYFRNVWPIREKIIIYVFLKTTCIMLVKPLSGINGNKCCWMW